MVSATRSVLMLDSNIDFIDNNNNNNNNNNNVFIYRSILKMGRIVSERLSIITNITNTTTKTT